MSNSYTPLIPILNKCSCRKNYCPSCGKKILQPYLEAMKATWNHESVRHVLLTVDPKYFASPEDAYNRIITDGEVSDFIRNIERNRGKQFQDWIQFREWHNHGFVHIHLLILVDKKLKGRDAQIGESVIKKYWNWGFYVHEDFIRNQNHWDKLIGYCAKRGYFQTSEKLHQVTYPEWALESNKRLRRVVAKPGGLIAQYINERTPKDKKAERGPNKTERKKREVLPHGLAVETCGKRTLLRVEHEQRFWDIKKLNIEYRKLIKELGDLGEYVKGVGFIVNMELFEFFRYVEDVFGHT